MALRCDRIDDLHHPGNVCTTEIKVKSEPVECEENRDTPELHSPVVLIKPEILDVNSPEVILPDWGYSGMESGSEGEDKDPVAMETIKQEHFDTETVAGKPLTSEDGIPVDTSLEIEEFSIKEELEDDLPVSVEVEERNEGEEKRRGKLAEVMPEDTTNSSEAGELYFHCQSDMKPSEKCFRELNNKRIQDEVPSHIPVSDNQGEYIKQPVALLTQSEENGESFKWHKLSAKEQCSWQEFVTVHNVEQNIHTSPLEGKQYECQICERRFSKKSVVKKHVQRVHQKLKQFECQQCAQWFGQSSDVKRHIQTVHLRNELFECEHCRQKFGSSWCFKQHVETVHHQQMQYECQNCGLIFSKRSNLKRHVKTVHMKQKLFKCDHCRQRFVQSHDMMKHFQNVHMKLKMFECPDCAQRFGQSCTLKRHIERMHVKRKDF